MRRQQLRRTRARWLPRHAGLLPSAIARLSGSWPVSGPSWPTYGLAGELAVRVFGCQSGRSLQENTKMSEKRSALLAASLRGECGGKQARPRAKKASGEGGRKTKGILKTAEPDDDDSLFGASSQPAPGQQCEQEEFNCCVSPGEGA